MVCAAAGAGGDVRFGHVVPPLVVLAGIMTASSVHQKSHRPRPFGFIQTPGQLPGWTFTRSRSQQRLTLSYESTDGNVQFVGLCHDGPIFLFLNYPDHGGPVFSSVDGKILPLVRLQHGGLMFEDLRIEKKLMKAKQTITLSIGKWTHRFSATPDISLFVAECRKMNATGKL